MTNPLVSVIVPVYNVERFLPQCLDSLLNQTYRELEIIAVNDGSTDHSFDVLKVYAEKDSRMCIYDRCNSGVSAVRNFALSCARGQYVMFVDSDDWLEINALELCINAVEKNDSDVCMFSYMREFNERSEMRALFSGDKSFDAIGCRRLQRRMIGPVGQELAHPEMLDSLGTIWGKLYKREIVSDTKFVDLKQIGTAEDTLFNCFAFLKVDSAVYIDKPLYHYRKYNYASETKKYKSQLPELWKNLFSIMAESTTDDESKRALNNRIALSILGLGLNEYCSSNSYIVRRKNILRILNDPLYVEAYRQLDFSYFPIHWKCFYLSAKYRCITFLLFMVYCINRIINR